MRILFSSHVFSPSVGGIETVSGLLAREFARQGHEIRLITETPGDSSSESRLAIHRQPRMRELLRLVHWCDVYFHNNISLPKVWPLLLIRRPWIVAHHVWIPRTGLAARAKRYALRYAAGSISISKAIAEHLDTPSTIVPNPYDDSLFRTAEGLERTRDLIFLGRLVSDKGADLLLSAAATLARAGLHPTITIVGSGPEEGALRAQVQAEGLASTVAFAGRHSGAALAQLLSQHRVLVIPSRWQEPFGVVALEAIAAGCVVVGSNGGGLPDAIGECGEVFPNGDAEALARVLTGLLMDPERIAALRRNAARHLYRHSRTEVASEYLRVFEQALGAADARSRTRRLSDV